MIVPLEREGRSRVRVDFTLGAYRSFLEAVLGAGYGAVPFRHYCSLDLQKTKTLILRHDVDKAPHRALALAEIQSSLGVRGTYYFRVVPESFDEGIMRKIADMGHEVGYHYEDLALVDGDVDKAMSHFTRVLERFRRICPIDTICMHGSPLSRWDNRRIWERYDYRSYGIIGEPYLDVDFTKVLYLTDTGRRWDGVRVSVRDKVEGANMPLFRSTFDIIDALTVGALPEHVMLTVHPQRWTSDAGSWMWELGSQSIKNVAKGLLLAMRNVES